MQTIRIPSLDSIAQAAREFAPLLKQSVIIAFYGEMGAGKTTFIKALCEELGVVNVVNSPTFAIVNEYYTSTNNPIYHFDFYRLSKPEELFDIGFEEYIASGNPCLIEWPEKAENLLPQKRISVYISINPDQSRLLSIKITA
jgi:tRNA threonylcarbamoyladenosine biosynthesis protein TsaE